MLERFDDPWGEAPATVLKGYDVAQICINGHVINERSESQPEHNTPHCDKCGAQTIAACPRCKNKIRGYYHVPNVVSLCGPGPAPAFCPHCGEGYPWTEAKVSAARELVREADRLSENEKGMLSRSLDDLIRDTPNTPVAAVRFKQLVTKSGPLVMEGLKKILVDVIAESAKKMIWP
jgi:hypothetical protein